MNPQNVGPLPEGWKEMSDPKTGKVYYYNKTLKETSWKRPPMPTDAAKAAALVADIFSVGALPPVKTTEPDASDAEQASMKPAQQKDTPAATETTPTTADSGPLPEGWKEMSDPKTGKVYYYNKNLKETSWKRPPMPADAAAKTAAEVPAKTTVTAPAAEEKASVAVDTSTAAKTNPTAAAPTTGTDNNATGPLPEGWKEMSDPKTGKVYYYNKTLKETSWKRPPMPVADAAAAAAAPTPSASETTAHPTPLTPHRAVTDQELDDEVRALGTVGAQKLLLKGEEEGVGAEKNAAPKRGGSVRDLVANLNASTTDNNGANNTRSSGGGASPRSVVVGGTSSPITKPKPTTPILTGGGSSGANTISKASSAAAADTVGDNDTAAAVSSAAADWVAFSDPKSGKTYYANKKTNARVWKLPAGVDAAAVKKSSQKGAGGGGDDVNSSEAVAAAEEGGKSPQLLQQHHQQRRSSSAEARQAIMKPRARQEAVLTESYVYEPSPQAIKDQLLAAQQRQQQQEEEEEAARQKEQQQRQEAAAGAGAGVRPRSSTIGGGREDLTKFKGASAAERIRDAMMMNATNNPNGTEQQASSSNVNGTSSTNSGAVTQTPSSILALLQQQQQQQGNNNNPQQQTLNRINSDSLLSGASLGRALLEGTTTAGSGNAANGTPNREFGGGPLDKDAARELRKFKRVTMANELDGINNANNGAGGRDGNAIAVGRNGHLPKHWLAATDLDTGKIYYLHQITRRRLALRPTVQQVTEEEATTRDILLFENHVKREMDAVGRRREATFMGKRSQNARSELRRMVPAGILQSQIAAAGHRGGGGGGRSEMDDGGDQQLNNTNNNGGGDGGNLLAKVNLTASSPDGDDEETFDEGKADDATNMLFQNVNHHTFWVIKHEPRINCYYYENALTGRIKWIRREDVETAVVINVAALQRQQAHAEQQQRLAAAQAAKLKILGQQQHADGGDNASNYNDGSDGDEDDVDRFETTSVVSEATTIGGVSTATSQGLYATPNPNRGGGGGTTSAAAANGVQPTLSASQIRTNSVDSSGLVKAKEEQQGPLAPLNQNTAAALGLMASNFATLDIPPSADTIYVFGGARHASTVAARQARATSPQQSVTNSFGGGGGANNSNALPSNYYLLQQMGLMPPTTAAAAGGGGGGGGGGPSSSANNNSPRLGYGQTMSNMSHASSAASTATTTTHNNNNNAPSSTAPTCEVFDGSKWRSVAAHTILQPPIMGDFDEVAACRIPQSDGDCLLLGTVNVAPQFLQQQQQQQYSFNNNGGGGYASCNTNNNLSFGNNNTNNYSNDGAATLRRGASFSNYNNNHHSHHADPAAAAHYNSFAGSGIGGGNNNNSSMHKSFAGSYSNNNGGSFEYNPYQTQQALTHAMMGGGSGNGVGVVGIGPQPPTPSAFIFNPKKRTCYARPELAGVFISGAAIAGIPRGVLVTGGQGEGRSSGGAGGGDQSPRGYVSPLGPSSSQQHQRSSSSASSPHGGARNLPNRRAGAGNAVGGVGGPSSPPRGSGGIGGGTGDIATDILDNGWSRPLRAATVVDIYTATKHEIPQMSLPRTNHALAILDVSNAYRLLWVAYAIGGFDGKRKTASVERYVLGGNRWEMMKPMNVARSSPATCIIDRTIYAFGGRSGYAVTNSCEKMHTQTDEWVMMKPMRHARCSFQAAVIKPMIIVVGGWDGSRWLNTCEAYDGMIEQWRPIMNLPSPRTNYGMCLLPQMPPEYFAAVGGVNATNGGGPSSPLAAASGGGRQQQLQYYN